MLGSFGKRLLLSCLLAMLSVSAHAVCGRNAQGDNFGIYEFDYASDVWVLVESYYSLELDYTEPHPEAVEMPPNGSWGGPPGGGGSGPPTHVKGATGAIKEKTPPEATRGACVLEEIIVTAVAGRPMGGGLASLSVSSGSRGGLFGFFRRRAERAILDIAGQNVDPPATCQSTESDRHFHALAVVRLLPLSQRRAGMQVRVTYNDGGNEVWIIANPYFSDPLFPTPKSNTLQCPG